MNKEAEAKIKEETKKLIDDKDEHISTLSKDLADSKSQIERLKALTR